MDGARDVVDEKEWRDVELLEAMFECDRRREKMMERFYNVMVESFGTGERRKRKHIENLLDCKRL